MVYPFSFHRLVMGGALYSERWNTSLSIYGPDQTAVSDTLLTSIANVCQTWFTGSGAAGPQFTNRATLTDVKLNRIAPNGKYQDPESKTHFFTTPQAGSAVIESAPQLTPVVTLRTEFERGRANRGRMYLPPAAGFTIPSSDGRATAGNAERMANAVATLINSINAAYAAQGGGGDFQGNVVVVSDVGTGAWHSVTWTECGRVIDTMRSRRSSLSEDYQDNTVAITP